jgi:hypothetical protein
MNVFSFVSYCGNSTHSVEMGDAGYFIRAMKRRGEAEPRLTKISRRCTLDTRTQQELLDWFGRLASWVIEAKFYSQRLVLVPIPNSDCLVENGKVPRTRRLADAVTNNLPTATVFDCLRWTHEKPPSHLGGCRDPRKLFGLLALSHVPSCTNVVLMDDVVTTGAHLQAAAAKLSSVGVKCDYAICLARTETSCLFPFTLKQTFVSNMLISCFQHSESLKSCTSCPGSWPQHHFQHPPDLNECAL